MKLISIILSKYIKGDHLKIVKMLINMPSFDKYYQIVLVKFEW